MILYKLKHSKTNKKHLTIALAGNANVGKSVVFNQLTGSYQIIGNWPGKTVEKAEGTLVFEGYEITVIDLPGIYSLSTFSLEELVTREYIAFEKPDVVINVVDASVLERNLFFTIQLMEMEVPLVICLNQMDMAKKKGIDIDTEKLEKILGVPVVPAVAVRGEGMYELIKTAIGVAETGSVYKKIEYSKEVEKRIERLSKLIEKLGLDYPSRWVAIKLLENDKEIKNQVASKSVKIIQKAEIFSKEISHMYKKPCFSVISSERYSNSSRIVSGVQKQAEAKTTFLDKLDWVTTHRVFGYVVSAGVIASLLLWTFFVGDFLSNLLGNMLSFFEPIYPKLNGHILSVLWNGVFSGFVAGITLVIPYVIPFYFVLAVLEDSGILTRVAFVMDSIMHKIGLHGKAIIPLILGYGCNVPAIYTTRIMESRRERLLAAFAITFVPCSARTIIILGLVAAFVGIEWALLLYLINIIIIFVFGRIAIKVMPGTSSGLIMEIHPFRVPSFSVITRQTWIRTKSIIYIVFPIYIIGSAAVQVMYTLGLLNPLSDFMSLITVWWLGLPVVVGTFLVFGFIRKELILLLLTVIYGTTNLALFLTPVQLITLALISMLYIPCVSTVIVLAKEFGRKAAILISTANIVSALFVGGLAFRLLTLLGFA
jgi:ferrous iron transport protein B